MPEGPTLGGSLSELRAGDTVETFTILPTEANRVMRTLHHRMPVILASEAADAWLAGDDVAPGPAPDQHPSVAPFTRTWVAPSGRSATAPENLLAMHRVSTRVNSPRHDDAGCVAPLESA